MIKYLKMKNYRSFNEIEVDFTKSNYTKKLSFIYGENGSGKSNFISSMYFLVQSFNTMNYQYQYNKIFESSNRLNYNLFKEMLTSNFPTMEDLAKTSKQVGSHDPSIVIMEFENNGKKGRYQITFNNEGVLQEELKYVFEKKQVVVYSRDKDTYFSPSLFLEKKYQTEIDQKIDKYFGKHTVMAILFYEYNSSNKSYLDNSLSSSMIELLDYFSKIHVFYKEYNKWDIDLPSQSTLKHNLKYKSGTIDKKELHKLQAIEKSLNLFYTSLYSDIEKIMYELEVKDDTINYVLYFDKRIQDKVLHLPYHIESTGTIKLLELFPYVIHALNGDIVFIDDIDNGIHDILLKEIIINLQDNLEDQFKGQIIATTHNTTLLESLNKDFAYVLIINSDRTKQLLCMNDYHFRIQDTHNLAKKYLSGQFNGIPMVGYLDFDQILTLMNVEKQ